MTNIIEFLKGLFRTYEMGDLFLFIATLILILLIIYIVYLVRIDEVENDININTNSSKNNKKLDELISKIEKEYCPKGKEDYIREEENNAIISYNELLERTCNNIVYEDDYDPGFTDVLVKKVDPTNTSNTQELVDLPKAVMMSYKSEKEFLNSLKVLQKNLVR